jgi:AraC-like DNA-binding protein
MTTDVFMVDAVSRFARECQIAAGCLVAPTDSLRLLTTMWRVLASLPPVTSDSAITRLVFDVVLQLATHVAYARQTLIEHGVPAPSDSLPNGRVVKALNVLLLTHRRPDVSIHHVAHEVGTSATHLSHLLRKTSGLGFRIHLNGLRVLSAVPLLSDNRALISAVSRECGFRSTAVFDRHVRKWLYVSPSRVRRLTTKVGNPFTGVPACNISGRRFGQLPPQVAP